MFDVFASRPTFHNHMCVSKTELLLYAKTQYRHSVNPDRLCCRWKGLNPISRNWTFEEWSPGKGKTHIIKAVNTVEPKVSVPSENGQKSLSLQFEPNLEPQGLKGLHSSDDDSSEMDEKETLRRIRISKANKGNVPWNKGRKHSPETLQRIRQRTKLAMQDPKVKMKLMNLGHAQSEETRMKIGLGVREGWQRRREMLKVQESCLFEWQNMIAEASRKGYACEDELQWDSYKILDEQLKQEWLESVEKRKTKQRPKGSKRAPKSLEQRRKISEAISAKWADPEYRGRVCSAHAKYHGIPVGVERKRRRRLSSETSSMKRDPVKKKAVQTKGSDDEAKSIKKVASRRRNATPSYKDPMASSKLEMIRKIRADRAASENKRKEAIERAKLLIAKAEEAAKALEVVALKSPLARASLIETRKLIAEATRSIESIESGQPKSHDSADEVSFSSIHESHDSETVLDKQIMIGSLPILSQRIKCDSSDQRKCEFFDFDRFTFQSATRNREDSGVKDFRVDQPKINGSIEYKLPPPERASRVKKTKKWVCGRLVEVDE